MLRGYTAVGNNDNLDRVVAPHEVDVDALMDCKKETLQYI
jgi:hypothetical protein